MFTRRYDGVRMIILNMIDKDRAVFRELISNRKVELNLSDVEG